MTYLRNCFSVYLSVRFWTSSPQKDFSTRSVFSDRKLHLCVSESWHSSTIIRRSMAQQGQWSTAEWNVSLLSVFGNRSDVLLVSNRGWSQTYTQALQKQCYQTFTSSPKHRYQVLQEQTVSRLYSLYCTQWISKIKGFILSVVLEMLFPKLYHEFNTSNWSVRKKKKTGK